MCAILLGGLEISFVVLSPSAPGTLDAAEMGGGPQLSMGMRLVLVFLFSGRES